MRADICRQDLLLGQVDEFSHVEPNGIGHINKFRKREAVLAGDQTTSCPTAGPGKIIQTKDAIKTASR